MIILLAVVIFVIVVIRAGSNSSYTTPGSTTPSTSTPTTSVHVSPTRPFDSSNPSEIYTVVHLLSVIVASKCDSSLYVYLKDGYEGSGRMMKILTHINGWNTDTVKPDSTTFIKLGLPSSAAQYLASIPFIIDDNGLRYDFATLPDLPSTYARSIMEEMDKGTRSSHNLQHGLLEIKITNNDGLICCRSIR